MRERTVAEIISHVAAAVGVPARDILSDRRTLPIARSRQMVCWLARQSTGRSMPRIARALNRDHTTVLHAIRNVDRLRASDEVFRAVTDKLLAELANDAPHNFCCPLCGARQALDA